MGALGDVEHSTRSKRKMPLRWHIDYLSAKTNMLGAITIPGPRKLECQLAKKLDKMFELYISGFGTSDCRCPGHLFYTQELP